MKNFLDQDFLLDTTIARDLYHNYAKVMPIYDYHCHLKPELVAEDRHFRSITELWIKDDVYKWRAMRTHGVEERYCIGEECSDWEKFEKWAEVFPYTVCEPLYLLSCLELKTVFGITKVLSPETAREIYDECNEKLQSKEYSSLELLRKFHVEVLWTTDDPTEDLTSHRQHNQKDKNTKMYPSWRPDQAMNIEREGFADYINRLGNTADLDIRSFSDMLEALSMRHQYFVDHECCLSDHDIEEFYDEEFTDSQIDTIFRKAMRGMRLSTLEIHQYKHCFLRKMAEMDYATGWTQQFHCGAIHDKSNLISRSVGRKYGFDSIGVFNTAKAMGHFMDYLSSENKLTRTILYSINPSSNDMIAAMLGNFQDGSCQGKIQFGLGWWLNNQYDAILRHLNAISVDGNFSHFIGFMTDCHSLLSFSRHEFFRRILCNVIGNFVERGLLPYNEPLLARLVEDISYNNVKRYISPT